MLSLLGVLLRLDAAQRPAELAAVVLARLTGALLRFRFFLFTLMTCLWVNVLALLVIAFVFVHGA